MTESKVVKYIASLRQKNAKSMIRINELTREWASILVGAAKDTLKPETTIAAAAIAYFSLFSLFPITLLSISIASFNLSPSMDRQFIIRRLEFVAPAMGELLGQNIDEVIDARGPVTSLSLIHIYR